LLTTAYIWLDYHFMMLAGIGPLLFESVPNITRTKCEKWKTASQWKRQFSSRIDVLPEIMKTAAVPKNTINEVLVISKRN
jgi:hypothetical protein